MLESIIFRIYLRKWKDIQQNEKFEVNNFVEILSYCILKIYIDSINNKVEETISYMFIHLMDYFLNIIFIFIFFFK